MQHKQQLVEEIGIFFERTMTPMEARVFGYLLLADPPHQDFFAIQEFLQASKSAISNALRRLMDQGLVEYTTFTGDRRRYFRINPEGWLNLIKTSMARVDPFTRLLRKVLDERAALDSPEFNEELRKVYDFHVFINEHLPAFLARWEKQEENR